MNTPRVFLTRRLPPPAEHLLREAGFAVDAYDSDYSPPREELLARVAGCAAVISSVTDRIDDETLRAAGPQLRVVANFAVGYDNIDLNSCRAHRVIATNTPDVLTDATADLAFTLILAAARRLHEGEMLTRSGRWAGWTPDQLLGLELRGATLGVVGAGRIGSAVATRAIAFGMNVVYSDSRRNPTLEARCAAIRAALRAEANTDAAPVCRCGSLDELLREADVVTLHVPMRPENRHLIDAAALGRMKPTAVLVNTARGPVVDEMALVEALRARRIAAAGLDVYEREPALAPGLTELENVVLAPHLGSATRATRARMSEMAARNVIAVLRGSAAPNAIGD